MSVNEALYDTPDTLKASKGVSKNSDRHVCSNKLETCRDPVEVSGVSFFDDLSTKTYDTMNSKVS